MLKGFNSVSKTLQKPRSDYKLFYKWQYKKEIVFHSLSTLHFLYDSKGLSGFLRMLKIRSRDVFGMYKKILYDRSNMRCDTDAVKTTLKISDIK